MQTPLGPSLTHRKSGKHWSLCFFCFFPSIIRIASVQKMAPPAAKSGRTPFIHSLLGEQKHEFDSSTSNNGDLGRKSNDCDDTPTQPLSIQPQPHSSGNTALTYDAEKYITHYLLATKRLEVNIRDYSGLASLGRASSEGFGGVVELLLTEVGDADVNSMDMHGRTPVSVAAQNGHLDVVRMLISKGNADPDLEDFDGRTPLSYAAENGHTGIVRLLLQGDCSYVDPNTKDHLFGWTPIIYAAARGHQAVVKLLCATAGVTVDEEDNQQQTASSYAKLAGHGAILELLEARLSGNFDMDAPNALDKSTTEDSAGSTVEQVTCTEAVDRGGRGNLAMGDAHGIQIVTEQVEEIAKPNGTEWLLPPIAFLSILKPMAFACRASVEMESTNLKLKTRTVTNRICGVKLGEFRSRFWSACMDYCIDFGNLALLKADRRMPCISVFRKRISFLEWVEEMIRSLKARLGDVQLCQQEFQDWYWLADALKPEFLEPCKDSPPLPQFDFLKDIQTDILEIVEYFINLLAILSRVLVVMQQIHDRLRTGRDHRHPIEDHIANQYDYSEARGTLEVIWKNTAAYLKVARFLPVKPIGDMVKHLTRKFDEKSFSRYLELIQESESEASVIVESTRTKLKPTVERLVAKSWQEFSQPDGGLLLPRTCT
ncbi:hypothetical protein QBC44DRAFT_335090, partial [Cladorrhinum sp. PSN332]